MPSSFAICYAPDCETERDARTPDGVPAAQRFLRETCPRRGKPCKFQATVVPFRSAADLPEPTDRDWVERQRRGARRAS